MSTNQVPFYADLKQSPPDARLPRASLFEKCDLQAPKTVTHARSLRSLKTQRNRKSIYRDEGDKRDKGQD